MLTEVLADNRLPLTLPRIDAELHMECEAILALKPSIWKVLADSCGASVVELRTECVQAVLVSACYIEMRLRPARELPWSLVGEGISSKLQNLKAGPKPENIVGGKMWELMQLGVYDEAVVAGVRLLEQAPWGGAAVEDLWVAVRLKDL